MNDMFNLYMDSSNALISAMKAAIQLINIENNLRLLSLNNKNSQNDINDFQAKNLPLLLQRIGQIKYLNNNLIKSCRNILELQQKILLQTDEKSVSTSFVFEISLVQQQLKAIIEFCKKDFMNTYLNISDLALEISNVQIMIKHRYENLEMPPYYKPIIQYLSDLYSLCIRGIQTSLP